jgi:hypothetical protein
MRSPWLERNLVLACGSKRYCRFFMFLILWLNEVQAIDPRAPSALLRVTLVEGPRSKVQWNRPILLDESHELNPWPLDEGPRPKCDKFEAKRTWHHFGRKINWFNPPSPPQKLKRRAHDLKHQDAS